MNDDDAALEGLWRLYMALLILAVLSLFSDYALHCHSRIRAAVEVSGE